MIMEANQIEANQIEANQIEANQMEANQNIIINRYSIVRETAIYVGVTVKNTLIVLGTHMFNETVRIGSTMIVSYTVSNTIDWGMQQLPKIVDKLKENGIVDKLKEYGFVDKLKEYGIFKIL